MKKDEVFMLNADDVISLLPGLYSYVIIETELKKS